MSSNSFHVTVVFNDKSVTPSDVEIGTQAIREFAEQIHSLVTDEDINRALEIPSFGNYDFGDYEDLPTEQKQEMYQAEIASASKIAKSFKENFSTPASYFRVLRNGNIFIAAKLPDGQSVGVLTTTVHGLSDHWRNTAADHDVVALQVINSIARRLIAQQ